MSINLKTPSEIASMRKAGKILAQILEECNNSAKPGMTTLDLEKIAERIIEENNALPSFKGYNGYPYILCVAVNEEVVHTFPSNKILKDGDLVTVDCGVKIDGLNTDAAVTFIVGTPDPDHKKFIDVVQEALYIGIRLVKPGAKTGDLGYAIEKHIKQNGYKIIKDLIGHGIGRELHEEPQVPNFGKQGKGPSLKPGMTFCIEPIVGYSTNKIMTLPDGWCIVTSDNSLSCQQEHTVLVTESGYEVLTLRENEII